MSQLPNEVDQGVYMRLKKLSAIGLSCAMITGCHYGQKNLTRSEAETAITDLRASYSAFNQGDIDRAVQSLDPNIEWTEPPEFPGGGTYHGIEGAKRYLAQSRAGAEQVISEPEKFIVAGNRIIVFVDAKVLPKHGGTWLDIKLADVYTFQNGRASEMHAFAKREDALRWAGIKGTVPDR